MLYMGVTISSKSYNTSIKYYYILYEIVLYC